MQKPMVFKEYKVEANVHEVAGVPGTKNFTGHTQDAALSHWCGGCGAYIYPVHILLPETNTLVFGCRRCLQKEVGGGLVFAEEEPMQWECNLCRSKHDSYEALNKHINDTHTTHGHGTAADDVDLTATDSTEADMCTAYGCMGKALHRCVICEEWFCQDCVHLFNSGDGTFEAGCKRCMEGRYTA